MSISLKKQVPSLYLGGDQTVKFTYEGERYCVHVHNDECPDNPRSWGEPATMACFHRRYRLGDDVGTNDPEEFWRELVSEFVTDSELVAAVQAGAVYGMNATDYDDEQYMADDMREDLTIRNCQQLLEPYLEWLPLWLYDHSGITMSCGTRTYPYDDAWDSGCVGWIIMTKKTALMERIGCCDASNWREKAIADMETEVKLYDQYLTGDVYGYTLLKEESDEWVEEESIWGFYGDDVMENGIADSVPGLAEAVKSGNYDVGEAKRQVSVSYAY